MPWAYVYSQNVGKKSIEIPILRVVIMMVDKSSEGKCCSTHPCSESPLIKGLSPSYKRGIFSQNAVVCMIGEIQNGICRALNRTPFLGCGDAPDGKKKLLL